MNYLKVYCNLMRKAQHRQVVEGYVEKHHIFPLSIYGKNNKIVVLSGREHYIAHALLEKICIKRYGLKNWKTEKMNFALISMRGNNREYDNSYLYENARIRRSQIIKGRLLYKMTDEIREKMSNARKGKPLSAETKRKMSEVRKGKKHPPVSDEIRKKRSEIQKTKVGKLNGMYGKKHSEETKKKMSEANIGRKQPKEQKDNTSKRTKELWKTGVFSTPEYREKLSQSLCKNQYKLIDETGNIYYTNNIIKFSKNHNLHYSGIYKVLKGTLKSYKGWTGKVI